jgi:CHAT domain-containing protein
VNARVDFHWASNSADSIDAAARRYSALCAQPRATWDTVRSSGAQLSFALFGTSLSGLPKDQALLLQPDGDLARIPWASLGLASGGILGERFFVAVVPEQLKNDSVPRLASFPIHRTLVIGATTTHPKWAADYLPLPGIREEIAAIRTAIPGGTVALEGESATVSNIERGLQDADGLHFAGHASRTPDGVRLLIAPDLRAKQSGAREGYWIPASAQGARLNLAVLSACATARYEDRDTLEPNDLARALMIAGARQVVAALWNADSAASSRFMQVLYANLGQGRSAPQAARTALTEIRQRHGWESPYYWAAFTLFVQE